LGKRSSDQDQQTGGECVLHLHAGNFKQNLAVCHLELEARFQTSVLRIDAQIAKSMQLYDNKYINCISIYVTLDIPQPSFYN